jgi:hypothetical protein
MHVSLLIGGEEFGIKYLFMPSVNFEETQWLVDWGNKYICPRHPLSLENNISAQQKWHIFSYVDEHGTLLRNKVYTIAL